MNALTQEYRLSAVPTPPKITAGLDAVVDRAIGAAKRSDSALRVLKEKAEAVDALAPEFKNLTDDALKERMGEYRTWYRRHGAGADTIITKALAGIREAAERNVGLRPFNVQIMGALAMRQGMLAEMATGEGKTLTAAVAAILAGWTHQPCHIVTVNDYLAQRDAEWLRPLYQFCGVTAGYVTGEMAARDRSRGHEHDVTYITSKEITADFLRDRLRLGELHVHARRMLRQLLQPSNPAQMGLVMRGLHTAIIDEADSVLIDEAVTPLIISGTEGGDALPVAYPQAWEFSKQLIPNTDYRVVEKYRDIEILPPGREKITKSRADAEGLWRGPARQSELIKQALTARELFINGRQYVVQDGKVIIVDEFTGRMMPMRRWRDGLHQMIEAKEGVEVSTRDVTLARMSFQHFFRLFRHLSGMTGTAKEAASEFWHIYRLPTIAIPTNKPCVRKELPDRVFPDLESKWKAVVEEISKLHAAGRPVLVGTRSIADSENLASKLGEIGLSFNLLNATRHREEAAIVSNAGQASRITIATNMAGRGTDIRLDPGVAALGGLHVLATERHESHRIDRQLYGRAGRQGDPGSAEAFVSLEDELMKRFIPTFIRSRLQSQVRHTGSIQGGLTAAAFRYGQFAAQRMAFSQRRNVLKFDTWLEDSLSFGGAAKA